MPPPRPSPSAPPQTARTAPSGPLVAEVDATLAAIHAIAPTLLDVRLRGARATPSRPAKLEATLDRGTKRLRCFLYTPDGQPCDRTDDIGRFLGLRTSSAAALQDHIVHLGTLNPFGAWTALPQSLPPEFIWDYARIEADAHDPDELLDYLEELAVDAPWLERIDALTREEGSSQGYTRLRRYVRFISKAGQEVAVIDMAYIPRLVDTLTFGETDPLQRNTQRLQALSRSLGMDFPALRHALRGLTTPFSFSARVRRLIINPPTS